MFCLDDATSQYVFWSKPLIGLSFPFTESIWQVFCFEIYTTKAGKIPF